MASEQFQDLRFHFLCCSFPQMVNSIGNISGASGHVVSLNQVLRFKDASERMNANTYYIKIVDKVTKYLC